MRGSATDYRRLFIALAAATALTPVAAAAQEASAGDAVEDVVGRLHEIYATEWAWRQEEYGTKLRDGRWRPGDRLRNVDPESQERRVAYWRDVLAEIEDVRIEDLPEEEKVNLAVFRFDLSNKVADGGFREWEAPVNSDSNFWSRLAERDSFRTIEAYEDYLGRMRDIPRYFEQEIANMRAGLKRGFTPPKVTLEGRDLSIVPFTEKDPEKNPFYIPFEEMSDRLVDRDGARLRREAKKVIRERVAPAYAELLEFFRTEYMPAARETLAAEEMPDGEAYYLQQIRQYTTLDLGPEEIHQIGLDEVARIEKEMRAIIDEVGFDGDIKAFTDHLRNDPQFVADTPDDLMGVAAYVVKRVDGKMKDYFRTLPRYRFALNPVPDAIAPFYTAGRGGLESCYINTYDLPSRPVYNIPALTVHECVPGHSFQAALALEAPDRPDFRKQTYFSGYGEGWGLYTEFLANEMGIYRTPYEHFGRLTYEMWRACRLVIDTGVHHYGWSREKAQAYLADRTALSTREVETEVDRYISWPAQALSYKLGEITIRRLRSEAEEALGDDFDIRAFHDTILASGSVPLSVLEDRIQRFIATETAGGEAPPAGEAQR